MIKKVLMVCGVGALLTACETPTTQRYSSLVDNAMAIRALNASGVQMGSLQPPTEFSANCRALGPLQVADNMSHTQYIQKAFEDELKIGGAFAGSPRVT